MDFTIGAAAAASNKTYLVGIHFAFDKLGPPELQGLVQREADALEEEAVLHATAVPKVVVVPQCLVELSHAQREGLGGQLERERKARTTQQVKVMHHGRFIKGDQ